MCHLLEELAKHRKEFEEFVDAAKILDQYYIPTRYANAFYSGAAKDHYTKKQAEEALQYAKSMLAKVMEVVSQRESST